MSEDDLIEAAPCKLRNGDWGCKTQAPVEAGDTVRIVTRANKQWRAEVTQVVWTDGQVCICATASENQKTQKPADSDKATAAAPRKRDKPASKRPRPGPATSERMEIDTPSAPPRTDAPPTEELDAMADRAAEDADDFDDVLSIQNEFERDPR